MPALALRITEPGSRSTSSPVSKRPECVFERRAESPRLLPSVGGIKACAVPSNISVDHTEASKASASGGPVLDASLAARHRADPFRASAPDAGVRRPAAAPDPVEALGRHPGAQPP